MKTGALGFALVKSSEVYIPYIYSDKDPHWPRRRLSWVGGAWAYPDGSPASGTATYGYGFIAHSPADCPHDLSEAEASAKLVARLADYEATVTRAWAKAFPGRPDPSQNAFDALVDFAWNEGQGAAQKLIAHLAALSFDDAKAVQALFLAWDKWTVDGKLVENDGLRLRRMKEAVLFLRPITIAWGPNDVANVLTSIHETAQAETAAFATGSPLPDDDETAPDTDRNS